MFCRCCPRPRWPCSAVIGFKAMPSPTCRPRAPIRRPQSKHPTCPTHFLAELGRAIFRFDTFGDEQLWTGVLRMHEPIATLSPKQALAVGLKVDVDALPPAVVAALKAGLVDLDDPGRHAHAAARERRRRREGPRQRGRRADERRHHLRAVSLDRRRLARARHRASPRRLGHHQPRRRRDRGAVAGARRRHQGGVLDAGGRASTIRAITTSTAPRSCRSTARRCRS